MTFGENLKAYLKNHGIRQTDLAVKAGIGQATVSLIIRSTRSPRIDTVLKILSALDLRLEDLCE